MIVATDVDTEWWGGVSAQTFVKTLRGMSGDLTIRINSPGGDVFAANAMKQAIAEYDGSVTAIVDGLAASAASVIAVACEKVIMAPGSMMMIHKAWTFAVGNADDMKQLGKILDKTDTGISQAYAAKADGEASHFLALMKAETWFTADEAVEEGLADEALPEAVEQRRTKAALWDLSVYQNAPALEEEPPAPEPEPEPTEDVEPGEEPDDANLVSHLADIDRRVRAHRVRMLQS